MADVLAFLDATRQFFLALLHLVDELTIRTLAVIASVYAAWKVIQHFIRNFP